MLPLALLLLAAVPAPPDPVLATWRTGEVRASDVAREEAFLTKDERTWREVEGHSAERTHRDWTTRVALRGIARELGPEEPALPAATTERARQAGRSWWLARWAGSCYGLPEDRPSDEELRTRLEERTTPARIRISHLFLDAATGPERAAAVARIEAWREAIGAAADPLARFRELAGAHSDSQSRWRDGRIGWLHRGWLPEPIEAILYELPDGTLSPAIPDARGVHLFFVEEVRPPEPVPTELRLNKLRGEAVAAARAECRTRRLAEARSRLRVERSDEEPWPSLAVGSWHLPGAVLAELQAGNDRPPDEVVEALLDDELLFQLGLAIGVPSPEERARIEDLAGNVWLESLTQARIEARIPTPTEEELRALYEEQPERYRRPPQMAGRELRAPFPPDIAPLDWLEAVERMAAGLRRGEITWASLADDPRLEETVWPLLPIIQVAGRLTPYRFAPIARSAPGEVVGPIQDEGALYLLQVLEREEQRTLPFDEARESVERAFRSRAENELRAEVVEELHDQAAFTLVSEEAPPHDAPP